MIQPIPDDKLRAFADEIQWAVRNYYKDVGFTRSDKARSDLKTCLAEDLCEIEAKYDDMKVSVGKMETSDE